MSDIGRKISQSGVNVLGASPSQLIYSSKYSNLKLHSIIGTTLTATSGSPNPSASIDNPLSYAPLFIPYISTGNGSRYRIMTMTDFSIAWSYDTNLLGVSVSYNSSTNKFDVSISTTVSVSTNYQIKIAIFVDKVSGTAVGINSNNDIGSKISVEGQAVESALDTDLSMTSEWPSLTVHMAGTASVSWNGSAYVPVVTHNLGFTPLVLAWFNPTGDGTDGSKYFPVPMSGSWNGGFQSPDFAVDSTDLRFQTSTGAPAETFRYLIFNQRMV